MQLRDRLRLGSSGSPAYMCQSTYLLYSFEIVALLTAACEAYTEKITEHVCRRISKFMTSPQKFWIWQEPKNEARRSYSPMTRLFGSRKL